MKLLLQTSSHLWSLRLVSKNQRERERDIFEFRVQIIHRSIVRFHQKTSVSQSIRLVLNFYRAIIREVIRSCLSGWSMR
ncbi:unnamed protein product [Camellia sinensis]